MKNDIDMMTVFKYKRKLERLKEIEEGLKDIKDITTVKRRKEMLKTLYSTMRMSIYLEDVNTKNDIYDQVFDEINEGIKRNTLYRG